MTKLDKKLTDILKKVFKKKKINKKLDLLKMGDFKEWDSLGNFNLILEVERYFDIKFNAQDFSEISSIKDIKNLLKKY